MTAPTAGSGPTHPPGHPGTGSPPPPPPPPPPTQGHLPPGAPGDRLPQLSEMVEDLRQSAVRMIVVAGRQYDPTSAPAEDYDPLGVTYADRILGCVVSDLRTVLRDLDKLAQTVQYPGPSDSSACLSGGSASHPGSTSGEGLSPGLAAGACNASARSDRPVVGPFAGSSHVAAPSVAASGGLLPGLAVPPGESEATRLGRGAGASSDPRPRIGGDAPEMTGVLTPPDEYHGAPGVGVHVAAGEAVDGMSTEGWPGPMAPSPQPPPPDPKLRRVVGQLLDHVFDALPSLLLFALAFGTRRLDVEFAAPLAFARPVRGKPIKPAKPAKPPKGPRRPLGTPPASS